MDKEGDAECAVAGGEVLLFRGGCREGLSEKMTSEQSPEASKGAHGYLWKSMGAEETASVKTPRWEQDWSV